MTGVGQNAFPGASPMKLVSDLRRPLPVGERVSAELADDRARDYFDPAGIPVPRGRDFHKVDEAGGATAVIATEQLVRQYLLKE